MKFATKLIHNGHAVDPGHRRSRRPDLPDLHLPPGVPRPFRQVRLRPVGQPDAGGVEEAVALLENGSQGLPSPREWRRSPLPPDLLAGGPPGGLRGRLRRHLPGADHPVRPAGDHVKLRRCHRSGSHRRGGAAGDQGALPGNAVQPAHEDHRSARLPWHWPRSAAFLPSSTTPS